MGPADHILTIVFGLVIITAALWLWLSPGTGGDL